MIGRAVKQAFDLHANGPCPNNHQVRKESQVGKQARERKRHKLVEPAQKEPGAAIALRKIPVQQHHVPGKHHTVAQGDRAQQALDGRQPQCQRGQGTQARHANGRGKAAQNTPIVLNGREVAHAVPVNDHYVEQPQAQQPLQQRGAREQQKDAVEHGAHNEHDGTGAPKRWQDLFFALGKEHVGQKARDRHGEKACERKRRQKRIGHHAHQQVLVGTAHTPQTAQHQDAHLQQHAQQHGARTHNAGVAIGAHRGKQALASKQALELKTDSCHRLLPLLGQIERASRLVVQRAIVGEHLLV